MARIPEYTSRFRATTSGTYNINQAMAPSLAVAGVADSVASFANQEIARQTQLKEKTFAADYDAKTTVALNETMKSVQKEFEADPLKGLEAFNAKMTESATIGLDEAPNERSRVFAESSFKSQGARALTSMKSWAEQQSQVNVAKDAEAFSDQLALLSSNDTSLESLNENLLRGSVYAEGLVEQLGPNKAKDAKTALQRRALNSSFETMVFNNELSKAKQVVKDEKYQEVFGAEGLQKARKLIKQKEERNAELARKRAEQGKKDPWSIYAGQGGDINFNYTQDPEGSSLRNSITLRRNFVEAQRDKGVPIPFLKPTESKQFESFVDNLPPAQAGGEFLKWVDLNTVAQDQKDIASSIYLGTKNSAMAMAMSMAADSPQDASLMVEGKRWFDDEQSGKGKTPQTGSDTFLKPSNREIMETFEANYPPSLLSAPAMRVVAREAAFFHYVGVQSKTEKGFSSGFDEKKFKESMQVVLGDSKIAVNGQPVLSFRNKLDGQFLSGAQLETLVDDLNDDLLKAIDKTPPITAYGEDINLAKSRGRLTIQPTSGPEGGDGIYYLLRGNEALLDTSKDGQNKLYTINLKELYASKEYQDYRKKKREEIFNHTSGPTGSMWSGGKL